MKLMTFLFALLINVSAFALETGKPAPDFKLKGTSAASEEIALSQFKGKTVVLEWLNHGCPFVKKHYGSGNMQSLQSKYTKKGIVWLSIISSAPGKQGHVDADGARADKLAQKSAASNVLLDPDGKVGKMYEAKTTPHMFIVSPEGLLVYQGAIDDIADADQASVKAAKNYVSMALDQMLEKKPITVSTTKSYGCGVKYE